MANGLMNGMQQPRSTYPSPPYSEHEVEAAQTLLKLRYGSEEDDEVEFGAFSEERHVRHLRCHGKDVSFKAADGSAGYDMLQERYATRAGGLNGLDQSIHEYDGETACQTCKRDRNTWESRYPADDEAATEAEGSGVDDPEARRWGAARYNSRRYSRVEFGQNSNRSARSPPPPARPPPRRRRQPASPAVKKETGEQRKTAPQAAANGNANGRQPVAPEPSREEQLPPLSTSRKRGASEELNGYGQGHPARTGDMVDTPVQAPAGIMAAIPPWQAVEDNAPAEDYSDNGQRKSRRVRTQTVKARESTIL